jgi:hypothetical protein
MSWLQLVQQLSTEIVSRIAGAGFAPLVDGAVLIGPEHLPAYENCSPNRIVMVPIESNFIPRRDVVSRATQAPSGGSNNPSVEPRGVLYVLQTNHGNGYTSVPTVTFSAPPAGGTTATGTAIVNGQKVTSVTLTNPGSGYTSPPTLSFSGGGGSGAAGIAILAPNAEQLAEVSQRALPFTDGKTFEVHIWGCTYNTNVQPPVQATNPDNDWDATEQLYQIFVQACQALMAGVFVIRDGVWISSKQDSAKLQMLGRYFRFRLEIHTPIPDRIVNFAPTGTVAQPTIFFQPLDGSPPEQP